ncbi:zinc ribbon domain-containing protein [Paenibacillus sp. LjRoot56]|uniref:zinc ribbon domain-containing protein n=1 Tax=Paenibacillus sp. LjRoot56 TaxID=3342333 RepID=UPI003F5088EF
MIECPWCHEQVQLVEDICPACRQEVLTYHLNPDGEESDVEQLTEYEEIDVLSLEERISHQYKCCKCKHKECHIKEIAMTGTGLSKMFDIQHHHFLAVSCLHCGYVEMYDPNVLQNKKAGSLGTILDIIFGG